MHESAIPARTDDLGNEDIPNAHVFGTMVLTPTNQSTRTEFEYSLPIDVLTKDDANRTLTYRLHVQKQPGIVRKPFTLKLQLPPNAQIEYANIPLTEGADLWIAQLNLRKDLIIEISFSLR
jgi:hypothetical protein